MSEFDLQSLGFTSKLRSEVHIRSKVRKGKKYITTIEGLSTDLDLKKIAKAIKKNYNTAASVIEIISSHQSRSNMKKLAVKSEKTFIIQVSGEKRKECLEFLTITNIIDKDIDKVILHGVDAK